MKLTAFVFDGVVTGDVMLPISAVSQEGDVTVRYVSPTGAEVWGFDPLHCFHPDGSFEDLSDTDVLLVPGGLGSVAMMKDEAATHWLKEMAKHSDYVLSVSTGSLLIAAAGLLEHRDASGHWLAADELAKAGAHPKPDSVTWEGHIVTTSGDVSAAEVAVELQERLAGS